MHGRESQLSIVWPHTFLILQLQIWNDGAFIGQMSNPAVLQFTEGQKNEKPGSVVSHCWPWPQVIKALLSFCQSSDSPNIAPWLILAVSSIRAYTKPWKDQHQVSVLLYTWALPLPESWPRSNLISSFLACSRCMSSQRKAKRACLFALIKS